MEYRLVRLAWAVSAYAESAWAYNVRTHSGRPIPTPDEETHTYPDLERFEIGGTSDIAYVNALSGYLIVLDYKTGRGRWHEGKPFGAPRSVSQLRTLALQCHGTSLFPEGARPLVIWESPRPAASRANLNVTKINSRPSLMHMGKTFCLAYHMRNWATFGPVSIAASAARSRCPTTMGGSTRKRLLSCGKREPP